MKSHFKSQLIISKTPMKVQLRAGDNISSTTVSACRLHGILETGNIGLGQDCSNDGVQ